MNKETCRHGLSMNEHHCALCMHEGKGARPTVIKDCQAYPSAEKEAESLRQQLAESQRQRIEQSEHLQFFETGIAKLVLENADLTAQLAQVQQAEPVHVESPWDYFPGYLIDHCEGEIITEEGLQFAAADMMKGLRGTLKPTPKPAAVAVVLPEEIEAFACWGCRGVFSLRDYMDADGRCPKCDSEIQTEVIEAQNETIAEVRRLNAVTTTVQELARLRGCEQDAARWEKLVSKMQNTEWLKKMREIICVRQYAKERLQDAVDAIQASQSQGE